MKLAFAFIGLIGAIAAGVLVLEHTRGDQKYVRLLHTGQEALDAGNSYGAIEAFTGAITLRPTSMVAYYHRGEAYRAQRQDDEAIRDFHAALRLAPEAPQPLVALGDLYAAHDPSQAASWYAEAAVRLRSDDPPLLYKLALARYRAGAPAEAVAPLQHALARNDSLAEAHYLLGLVYRDLRRLDDATASLERAVKLVPGLIPAREELADIYHLRGRAADEMAQLQALAALDTSPARTVRIGLASASHGEYATALEALSAAASRAPAESRVRLALARVYLARAVQTGDRRDVTRALDALERALGGTDHRSEKLALFGRALSLAGDDTGAERLLRSATATTPVDAEAFGYLADTAERLLHFADARDALLRLDGLQGDTIPAADRAARMQRLGTLSWRAADVRGAVAFLTQAVASGEQDVRTLGLLAQARLQSGDRQGANDALERALALQPKNADLLLLKRQLQIN